MTTASKLLMSIVSVGAILAACSDAGRPPVSDGTLGPNGQRPGSCHRGLEGCPCDTAGAVAVCGTIKRRDGDFVVCSEGQATCTLGEWSPCQGDRVVSKSLTTVSLSPGGLHFQSTMSACTDPCDPACQQISSTPGDVDASGIQPNGDGGVTLAGSTGGVCNGLLCNVASCGGKPETTTLSGTVYDPAGNVPLYDVFVYVPVDPDLTKLPVFPDSWTTGVSCDSCSGSNLNAAAVARTGPDGRFTLTAVPSGPNIPLVVQIGKWRRVIVLSTVTACGANTTTNNCSAVDKTLCTTRLPRNRFDGYDPVAASYSGKADIPRIAMVTGGADPFECMLLKAGIDPQEVGSSGANSARRIHLYTSPDSPGTYLDNSASPPAPYGDQVTGDILWNSGNQMKRYDAVILACEGTAIDKKTGVNRPPAGVSPYKNLLDYTTAGGRAFATHFSYVWLQYPFVKDGLPDWKNVANWTHTTGTTGTQDPLTASIVTTFPKGAAFAQWLVNVGASTTPNQLDVHEARQDLTTIGTGTQGWMTAHDNFFTPGDYTPNFAFDTPYAAPPASQCGRVVFSDYHVSAAALINPFATSRCASNVDCGFTATCVGAGGTLGTCNEPCASASECFDATYSCPGAVVGTGCQMRTCAKNSDCKRGICNTVAGMCECTQGAQCGSGTCNIPGGKVSGTCAAHACATVNDCGKIEVCNGSTLGNCTKLCTVSADCGNGEICVSGSCTGCSTAAQCTTRRLPGKCTGATTSNGACTLPDGTTPNNDPTLFPEACQQGKLTPQEKALEFLFFDLTACVGTPPPPVPTTTFASASFVQDYVASCGPATHPVWREVDWQAVIPSTASIDVSAQSGPTTSSLKPAAPIAVAHATTSTATPAYDVAYLDTGTMGTGAFSKASPRVLSDNVLRVTITLHPTTDSMATPTLETWKVLYDCPPTE